MSSARAPNLSRRERQIMDVIYQSGQASVAQVVAGLADPPSYSAVRALLRVLENKGHLKHQTHGAKYVYLPMASRRTAGRLALRRLVRTFFDNSAGKAMVALIDASDGALTADELNEVAAIIDRARKEGK